jgi:thiol-disulfide isomerase/thioredoxin
MPSEQGSTSIGKQSLVMAGISILVVTAAVAVLLLGKQSGDGAGRPDAALPARLKSISSASAALSFYARPRAPPDIRFTDGEGHALSLADFQGRAVIFSFWATWCVPCRQEMPTLDRLQALFGKTLLAVVPVSIDGQGASSVTAFYRKRGLKNLSIYLDPSAAAARALNLPGVPATLLLDRDGREAGRKIGPLDWFSPAIVDALRRNLQLP